MYSSIYELPSQVLASLDDKDAAKWMKVYNNLDPHSEEEIKKAKREAWHACKDLPSSFSFKIRASVDNIDKDKEIIDIDSIKKHMDSYIDYGGNVQWNHQNYTVANIWDWEPIKVDGRDGISVWGNIYGGDIVYDQMRKAFVEGKNSLSVAGEALPGKFQCDERGCYTRRDVKQLMEISLCAVPANNLCTMEWYNDKASFTKSESVKGGLRFNVDEYEIHKTYNECPMLSLKKSLEDIGYEAHATNAGVFIKMDDESFRKALPYMHANNLHVIRLGDYVCLNDYDYLTELSFKKGYENGYIDKDGYILDSIQKSDFETLYERDILVQDDEGRYRLLPFGKVANWKQYGDEARPDHPIVADHIIAYNSKGTDDGTYHPEFVGVPKMNGAYYSRDYAFPNPDYNDEEEEVGTNTQYLKIPHSSASMLNLSRRNSGEMKDSNGFIDLTLNRPMYQTKYLSDPSSMKGFTAHVSPKSHRVFTTVDDYINFVKQHSIKQDAYNHSTGKDDVWLFPDFDAHVKDGIYSVEFPKSFFDDLEKPETRKKLYDANVGMLASLWDEPQIGILDKRAIMHTEPYSWKDTVDKNNPRVKTILGLGADKRKGKVTQEELDEAIQNWVNKMKGSKKQQGRA